VPEEDVGLAITVEVPTPTTVQSVGGPARGPRADDSRPVQEVVKRVPEVCRKRMSALPSPLKSPTPTTVQSVEAPPGTPCR